MLLKRQLDQNLEGDGIITEGPLAGLDLGDPNIKLSSQNNPTPDPTPTPTPTPTPVPDPTPTPDPVPDPDPKNITPPVFTDEHGLNYINEKLNGSYADTDQMVNEFTDLKTKATNFDKREKDLQELAKRANNPLVDYPELAKALSFFKANTVDGKSQFDLNTFSKIQGLDLEKVNHLDLMVNDFLMKNSDVSKKEATEYFEDKYKLSLEAFDLDETDDDYDKHKLAAEKEIRKNTLAMRMDSAPILENFKKLKSSIIEPDFEVEAQQRQEATDKLTLENKTKWESLLPKITDTFKEYQAFKPGEKEPYITMEVSEEQRKEMQGLLTNYLENSGWKEVNKENAESVMGIMQRMYSDMHQFDIANAFATKKVAENDELWHERSGIDPNQYKSDPPTPDIPSKQGDAKKQKDANNAKMLGWLEDGTIAT